MVVSFIGGGDTQALVSGKKNIPRYPISIYVFFFTRNKCLWGNRRTRRKPLTCRKSLTNYCIKLVHLLMSGIRTHNFTVVVIGTDCTGSCKSNYHTIMTMTALRWKNSYIAICHDIWSGSVRICFKYLF